MGLMVDWKSNKGSGPWDFTEQPNKWGYLNNPLWSGQQDAQEFCEKVGLSLDLPDQHKPCGHWHKGLLEGTVNLGPNWWWQPSIDVRDGIIGVVAIYSNGVPEDRIVGLIYDKATKVWKCLGYSYIEPIFAEPNTCRLSNDYMAFYCTCNTWEDWYGAGDGNRYFGRLYIFESGHNPRYFDPWECNWSTKTPYKIYQHAIYNVMDCAGDRIACAALVIGIDGVFCYKWMIKISDDKGASFHTEYSLPNADIPGGGNDNIDEVYVRMSADGIVWIAYLRSNSVNTIIELWKSNAGAGFTTFSKIWETDYSASMDGQQASKMVFDVSDFNGKRVTISLLSLSGATYYRVTYYSTDYGVNFSSNIWTTIDYSTTGKGAVNGAHVLLNTKKISINDYFFMLSSDYGLSYNEVDPNVPGFTLYYADCQKYNAEVVYTECSTSFVEGSTQQGLLSSEDYGANWEVISMPIHLVDTDNQPVIWDGVSIDEPISWPFEGFIPPIIPSTGPPVEVIVPPGESPGPGEVPYVPPPPPPPPPPEDAPDDGVTLLQSGFVDFNIYVGPGQTLFYKIVASVPACVEPIQVSNTPQSQQPHTVHLLIKKRSKPTIADFERTWAMAPSDYDCTLGLWLPTKPGAENLYWKYNTGSQSELVQIKEPMASDTYYIMLYNNGSRSVRNQHLTVSYSS